MTDKVVAPPQITIIIPIYNVEAYLWQCLDSVVNQTMRDIQIICVNDGSPDNSRAILQEYADRDVRVEIIDKPNGGLSSARNAACPHIRGKYTLFVDSDDWVELDLCEKVYRKAEESGAELTVFLFQTEGRLDSPTKYASVTPDDKTTVEEKTCLLGYPVTSAWSKLWRTDFLLEHKLYFPEGLVFEDNVVNWQAVIFARRIAVLPESLYHYRFRVESIMRQGAKNWLDVVPIFAVIRDFLETGGYYPLYRERYHEEKWKSYMSLYTKTSGEFQRDFRKLIHESVTDEDREYFRSGKAKKELALFYKRDITGELMAVMCSLVSWAVWKNKKLVCRRT